MRCPRCEALVLVGKTLAGVEVVLEFHPTTPPDPGRSSFLYEDGHVYHVRKKDKGMAAHHAHRCDDRREEE